MHGSSKKAKYRMHILMSMKDKGTSSLDKRVIYYFLSRWFQPMALIKSLIMLDPQTRGAIHLVLLTIKV